MHLKTTHYLPEEVIISSEKANAGDAFNVQVKLSTFVGPGDKAFLKIKYHRVIFKDNKHNLQQIDYGYLDPNFYPTIIEIVHPDSSGDSGQIKVKPNATQPENYPKVELPEDLLVTVYVEGMPEMNCSKVIRIFPATS